MFYGAYTAIITPWKAGELDLKNLEKLIDLQIAAGVQGIVPCGTTGESLSLSTNAQNHLIETCVRLCKGKIQVMAATGNLSTEETILRSQEAQKMGADSLLIISPWYTRPSQDNLYTHFKSINDAVHVPIMLYNNPARTGVDIGVETVIRLAECKNIQALKDGGACLSRITKLRAALGSSFPLLECIDERLPAFLAMGGDGAIGVASNIVPALYVQLIHAWRQNDLETFKALTTRLMPLFTALGLESNPGPVKYAAHLVHGTEDEYALSYVSLTPQTKQSIQNALLSLGVWAP